MTFAAAPSANFKRSDLGGFRHLGVINRMYSSELCPATIQCTIARIMITRDQFIKSMLGAGLAASPLSSAQQPATKKGKTTVERTDVSSVQAGAVAKIDAWSHAIPRPYLDRLTVLPAGPHSAVV
jgi:hypothetical protein